jgi:putative membrane protein
LPVLAYIALDDQRLGGLIMWMPGGISYLVAAIAIVWRSLVAKDGIAARERLTA